MSKEEWIEISRDKGPFFTELPIQMFYAYYLEAGGTTVDIKTFTATFFECCMGELHIRSTNRSMNYESSMYRMYQYYNKKFDIWQHPQDQ